MRPVDVTCLRAGNAESHVLDERVDRFPTGEVLDMGAFAWSLLAVLVVVSALGGWTASGAIQRRWRQELIRPGAWGEPDSAPPSVSPDAQAEVAELEALWALPPHRASRGPTEI